MPSAPLSRRCFLKAVAGCGFALAASRLLPVAGPMPCGRRLAGVPGLPPPARAAGGPADPWRHAPVARWWAATTQAGVACATCHTPSELPEPFGPSAAPDPHRHQAELVKCLLCARGCALKEGERGECGARLVRSGRLLSLTYGRPVAVHVDPIEKKPFYHFLPGALAYSFGTAGCPLHCDFCQNWELSQSRPEDFPGPFVPPAELITRARRTEAPIIAFTYDEPTVFAEYLIDVARAARQAGLRPVLVSCGIMNEAPLAEMCDVLDAIKIDLKGFSEEFYRKVSHAELAPVLRSIRQVAQRGVHLEIVNLVVPTLNDSETMLQGLAGWLLDAVGPDVPVHFTRFHPDYRLQNLPPTPVETLERARAIALAKGLRYVYVGNVPGHPGNDTGCPRCGALVIRRSGFLIEEMHVKDGKCARCGAPIAGVWS